MTGDFLDHVVGVELSQGRCSCAIAIARADKGFHIFLKSSLWEDE